MKSLALILLSLVAIFAIGGTVYQATGQQENKAQQDNTDTQLGSRAFTFNYGATILEVPTGAKVRVWYPIAESSGQQEVSLVGKKTPTEMQVHRDEKYNNAIGFFETSNDDANENSSEVKFKLSYDVVRKEASVDDAAKSLTDEQKKLFLAANSLVPVDGKPTELLDEENLPADSMGAGKRIYEIVEDHMKYDKSQPGYGNGDSTWACDSKTGNCTDFHSLFISLARNREIPARFEIGFPLPPKSTTTESKGVVKGYHCWAWFHSEGNGWAPVDISEADKHPEMKAYYFGKLTTDRIAFSTGRDIKLVPASNGGPLNYFVYPYVEVDGKPWPKDKIKLDFSYSDK
ncbi:MAG: transglutaminase-like domain-containing protein [Mariniblastus sp.]